jgi:pimeloyl-ACP methyl ester carboxylesterase
LQAHFVNFLQLPVVRSIANATFSQLLRTITTNLVDGEAFDPQPIDPAHKHRVLAINMTSGNLKAYAGEELEANDVFARIDPRLGTIDVPAVVIQGEQDQLVKPSHGRRLAAALPDARLEMIHGGHMAPYTHPYAVAAAVGTVERASFPRTAQPPKRHAQAATGTSPLSPTA